jgi:DNA-binding transcriptional MocR family regulator
VDAISDLPMLHDIDADYSPQYIKLARILRCKIKSGHYQYGDALRSADLVSEHGVSAQVAWHALATLAANRYVARSGAVSPYRVTWKAHVPPVDGANGPEVRSRTRGVEPATSR